jgi:EPTP domain
MSNPAKDGQERYPAALETVEKSLLRPLGTLPTSGARAAEIFTLSGETFLAVPQLAYDLPDTPPYMNGGDSDTDLLIFRWNDKAFVPHEQLPVPGGEDAEFFKIGDTAFLATASGRKGKGPYEPNVDSVIFRFEGSTWVPFQSVPGFLAKQWKYFSFAGRHFLGFAVGVTVEGLEARNPRQSMILEWDGARFQPFQTLDGPWGYNWTRVEAGDREFLAYADHTGQSQIFEWKDDAFQPFQRFEGKTGRAFEVLRPDGRLQIAFAAIADDTGIYEWNGEQFTLTQTLSGPGGREFASIEIAGTHYLVQVNFIEGTPKAPKTDLLSHIYRWSGSVWERVESFATFGATDARFFRDGEAVYLVVTNSLTPEVRFGQDSAVYEFLG